MATTSPTAQTGSVLASRLGRALLIALWFVLARGVVTSYPHPTGIRALAAWGATVVFLVVLTLAAERTTLPLVAASAAAAVALQLLSPSNSSYLAAIATIAVAGGRLETRPGLVVSGLVAIAFLAGAAFTREFTIDALASITPGLLFTYVAATSLRRLRVEQRRAESLLREVVANRDAQIRAAALDERSRLAREMHDVLAHTLSALTVQLEGTRMLVEQRSSDPSVEAAVERASRLAREGLEEARRAMGSLRGDTLPGPDLLARLAEDFEHDSGTPCRLAIEGEAVDLSPEARLAVYRTAQESLTNIRKHADVSSVEIALRYGPHGTELIVENRGTPSASPLPGSGYGLSGMRERAALLGGRLEAGPTATGFRVCLWIPR